MVHLATARTVAQYQLPAVATHKAEVVGRVEVVVGGEAGEGGGGWWRTQEFHGTGYDVVALVQEVEGTLFTVVALVHTQSRTQPRDRVSED